MPEEHAGKQRPGGFLVGPVQAVLAGESPEGDVEMGDVEMGHAFEGTTLFSGGLLGCSSPAFQVVFMAGGARKQVVNLEKVAVCTGTHSCPVCSRNVSLNIKPAKDEEGCVCRKTCERHP